MSSKKETRRDAIIDAAFLLFLKNGYQSTKIIDIANAAGIGKGTVYEYFDSKETLLAEILKTKFTQFYTDMDATISSMTGCRAKLCAFLNFHKECFLKYHSSIFEMRNQLLSLDKQLSIEIFKVIHRALSLEYRAIHQIVETGINTGELREGINPSLAASCLMGAIDAYVSVKYADRDEVPCEIELILSTFPKDEIETWTEDSFLDILYAGLGKSAEGPDIL